MTQASAEKLEQTGSVENKGASQSKQFDRAAFAKGQTNRAISLDHQIVRWGRLKVRESLTLVKIRMVRM